MLQCNRIDVVRTEPIEPPIPERHKMSDHIETRGPAKVSLRLAEKLRFVTINPSAARSKVPVAARPVVRWYHREIEHPGIAYIGGPVVVAPDCKTVLAPFLAPGILDPETAFVVSNDREGVHADQGLWRARFFGVEWDFRLSLSRQPPASMDVGRCEHHTGLGDRRLRVRKAW